MKIFLGAKFTGVDNKERLEEIRKIILELGHKIFVGPIDLDDYGKNKLHPEKFMKKVFEQIKSADVVLIKHTTSSTGSGIEAGYAFAMNKRIIVLYPIHAEKKSNSINGIANNVLNYKDYYELRKKLKEIL